MISYLLSLIAYFLLFASELHAEAGETFEFDTGTWEDAAEPGPELERLKKFAGDWKLKMKVWRGDNKNPDFFSGKASYEWKLDERVLLVTLKSKSLTHDYQGLGNLTYDSVRKKYVGTWTDTGSPGITYMLGEYDEETKSFQFVGEHSNPQAEKATAFMSEVKIESEDKFRIINYAVLKDGGKKKVIEYVYSKKT